MVNLIRAKISKKNVSLPKGKVNLQKYIKRPEVSLFDFSGEFGSLEKNRGFGLSLFEAETTIKYEGYIARQNADIQQAAKLQDVRIPSSLDINLIPGLSNELKQKLSRIQPETIGQASRISGITPAAINILMVYIKKNEALIPREI